MIRGQRMKTKYDQVAKLYTGITNYMIFSKQILIRWYQTRFMSLPKATKYNDMIFVNSKSTKVSMHIAY